jgi:LAO/AO transport system kinase
VIGLTGAPGVGKSTIVNALVAAYRERGTRVGVLAIDPSSPFTGGALLGDRIRMQDHALDEGVFIRSMASRGHLGGLAAATPQALRALEAAGYEIIMIETVGVGQVEVEVASLADSVLVLVAPGMGDAIQAAKAGILEIADLFAVNKADRPDTQQTVRDLRNMIALARPHSVADHSVADHSVAGHEGPGHGNHEAQETHGDHGGAGGWKPPIVTTIASSGEGIGELTARLDAHWSWLSESGELERRRRARAREEVAAIAVGALRKRMAGLLGDSELDLLAGRVAQGEIDPYAAADELVGALTQTPAAR